MRVRVRLPAVHPALYIFLLLHWWPHVLCVAILAFRSSQTLILMNNDGQDNPASAERCHWWMGPSLYVEGHNLKEDLWTFVKLHCFGGREVCGISGRLFWKAVVGLYPPHRPEPYLLPWGVYTSPRHLSETQSTWLGPQDDISPAEALRNSVCTWHYLPTYYILHRAQRRYTTVACANNAAVWKTTV
jgi:hypothetical protein